ncbi:hypothetical protein LIER_15544 [Lithospermum erythrorhizon]|uniref:Uncharacterized protein n=1 Tax=Lithospermum erythrorhizon TaxID=34254 RepID=A0AAV3Q5U4_LITER
MGSLAEGIALKATSEDVDEEDLVEYMNLLANNINKPLKRFNKKRMEEPAIQVPMTKETTGKLEKENEKLTQMVLDCDDEIKNLNAQLKALNKGLKNTNNHKGEKNTNKGLDEILVIGKDAGDITGIGYERRKSNNRKGDVKFVPAGGN